MKNAKLHKEIESQNWDQIIVSVSGGKDSAALMQFAIENFPKEKIICVHAVIDIDWHETLPVVREQCAFMSLPLVEVQAVDMKGQKKGFIDQLTSPRVNRKTGAVGEYQFPSMANRWCTSVLKTGPIDKYCRSLKGSTLVLIGERREESNQRAQLSAIRPDAKLSVAGRTVVKYSPILDMTEADVWAVIDQHSIPKHPCYSLGVSRASCAICIFSSKKEIAIAAVHAPDIVKKYIEAEKKISHTFRFKKATKKSPEVKETIEQILKDQGITIS